MQTKFIRLFLESSIALLATIVAAQLICNVATTGLTQPHDAILQISIRTLFWILSGIELLVVFACVSLNSARLKLVLIFWVALNMAVYWAVLQWNGGHGIRGYLGGLSRTFGVSTNFTDVTLKTAFIYLLAVSFILLVWSWLQKIKVEEKSKIPCPQCGGRIEFFAQNVGQKTPCPHCQKILTLRRPENLKMSCFFCRQHIEFPDHAIGEKMPCPHCKMDITLKEPAVN